MIKWSAPQTSACPPVHAYGRLRNPSINHKNRPRQAVRLCAECAEKIATFQKVDRSSYKRVRRRNKDSQIFCSGWQSHEEVKGSTTLKLQGTSLGLYTAFFFFFYSRINDLNCVQLSGAGKKHPCSLSSEFPLCCATGACV